MAQIGTVKVETAGGPVELPVYELGDSGSNRVEAFRVQTASGPGFVPLTEVSAADRPYLRVQTANGVKAFDTSASGIPDSALYRYPIFERSSSTIEESINNEDATANGTTNVSGNWIEGYAESGDGSSGYIESPAALATWLETTQNQWVAMTINPDPSASVQNDTIFGFADTGVDPTEEWNITDIDGDGRLRWRIAGSDGSIADIQTDNVVIDGNPHRLLVQRSGPSASDMEISVDGGEVDTSVLSSGTFNGAYDSTNSLPYWLASHLNGSPGRHLQSIIDNLIFGQLGTTLSASQIQDDYDAQPWS